MRFLHISDLHLGIQLSDLPLIDEQEYILNEIADIAVEKRCDAVVIAGDIYDKSMPTVEAVHLFDSFLTALNNRKITVLAVSGNHDNAERISFAGSILSQSGVYFSKAYDGDKHPVVLCDDFGQVNFYLLPYIRPSDVRNALNDTEIKTFDQCVSAAVRNLEINSEYRNVIVAHQFVTGASRCDSEFFSVGGTDNVSAEIFAPFDYAALGHIHTAQKIGGYEHIRYCGTPLKYSLSELNDNKSVCFVEMREKGSVTIEQIPLKPQHDMFRHRGAFCKIMSEDFRESVDTEGYTAIVLTDEVEIPDAYAIIREAYPRYFNLTYDNERTRSISSLELSENAERKNPMELFTELYEMQNGRSLTDKQKDYLSGLIETVWRNEE